MSRNRILRSTIDKDFATVALPVLLDSCSVLKGLKDTIKDNEDIPVEMSKKHLQQFVNFHSHFPSADAAKDLEWSNAFFREMSEDEFKSLCQEADYLDSQRFLEAVGDFILCKFEELEVPEIQRFLNINDDFSSDERRNMEEHTLEYFSGVSFKTSDDDTGAPDGNATTDSAKPDASG